jgi:hypothetical protein
MNLTPAFDGRSLSEHTTSDRNLSPFGPSSSQSAFEVAGRLPEAHAAARWAKAIVPLMDCPRDPKTIALWGDWIAVSPGALRNWCRTAGVSARRSLIFGRLLRAVHVSDGARHKPENVLDVVDRRTLAALLRFSGLNEHGDFPASVRQFLTIQTLIDDVDTLIEVERVLVARGCYR